LIRTGNAYNVTMRRLGRKLRRLRSLSRKEKTTQAREVCVVFVVTAEAVVLRHPPALTADRLSLVV